MVRAGVGLQQFPASIISLATNAARELWCIKLELITTLCVGGRQASGACTTWVKSVNGPWM